MSESPARRPDRSPQRPGHPALAGAILMIGIVVLLILLAVASL